MKLLVFSIFSFVCLTGCAHRQPFSDAEVKASLSSTFADRSFYLSEALSVEPKREGRKLIYKEYLIVDVDTGWFKLFIDTPISFESLAGWLKRSRSGVKVRIVEETY